MAKYVTKQRKTLLDCLSKHPDESLSAKEIAKLLEDDSISLSAVYRNLVELEKDNTIRRVTKAGSREVLYQYSAAHECKEKLHLSCKKCGKTYHMSDSNTEMLIKSLATSDDFEIDMCDTVLYGVCTTCKTN